MASHDIIMYFPITPATTPDGLMNPAAVIIICLHCPVTISSISTISVKAVFVCPAWARLRRIKSKSTVKNVTTTRGLTGIGTPNGLGTSCSVSSICFTVSNVFISFQYVSISSIFWKSVSSISPDSLSAELCAAGDTLPPPACTESSPVKKLRTQGAFSIVFSKAFLSSLFKIGWSYSSTSLEDHPFSPFDFM